MNFHTHPAAFASNVVNSLWGMQITSFPPSQQYGSSHGGSTMRESGLKHICDPVFCPSAMRNLKRRGDVSRRPAARPRRSPQICTVIVLLDYKLPFFHHNVNSSTARARLPRTPQDQCCCMVLPSRVHAKCAGAGLEGSTYDGK